MKTLPHLGVGVGFREPLRSSIFLNRDKIDVLEITSDHYLDASARKLDELELLKQHFTLIPHSLELSLGSAEGVDEVYLDRLGQLIKAVDPPWFSDHICFTHAGGRMIGHLASLPFTNEALGVLIKNIDRVKRQISTPLILENITYNVEFSSSEMTEPAFITKLLAETDCGLLLDATNLYINATNLGYDWRNYLDAMPLDRVVQLHFVGYRKRHGRLIDVHSDEMKDEIWEVIGEICARCDVKAAILERDDNFPDFSAILDEVETARELMAGAA